MSTASPHIVEATSATFERDVLDRSREVPIVVDFWASWCAPCRQLGPVLERLAVEYDGRFVLVKADTEQLPGQASAFGVRSIPAVFGLRDGRIVDGFVGVLAERAIRSFLDRLVPTPAETLARAARPLEATDPAAAAAQYREALVLDSHLAAAHVGLARLDLAAGRRDEAAAHLTALERRGPLDPEAEALRAELALRSAAGAATGLDAARAAVEADPADFPARLRLAEALAAAGLHDEALPIALDLVERDRRGVGEPARQLMLQVFNLLPADSPLAADFRRRLSFAL